MIELSCPTCDKLLRIDDKYRGTLGKCNGCGCAVFVPTTALTPAQQTVFDTITKPPKDSFSASPTPAPTFASRMWTKFTERPPARAKAFSFTRRPQPDAAERLIAAQRAHTRAMNSNFSCLIIVLLVLFCPIWIPIVIIALGGLLAFGG
jgi:hypothetical protein